MVIDDSANTVGYEVTHMINDQFPSNVAYSLKDVAFSYSKGKRAESEAVLKELSCLIQACQAGACLEISGVDRNNPASGML